MDKKDLTKEFEKNVRFLSRSIPPDDIYAFGEYSYMASLFFLEKWYEGADFDKTIRDDPTAKRLAQSVLNYKKHRDILESIRWVYEEDP